uniref:Pickpocket protein 28-like n=1 Tax=Diabrotica virgifera virgifera TaxID=50390 RepID=A0A6P7FZG4_DIAVI
MPEAKVERPPFFKSVRNYFREYCNCTSIHGFRYFGEKRTYFERGWWFIVFTVTLVACIISIREVYKKWLRAPVIVSFATKETPIYSIPFPAVTICPETKSTQSLYSHMGIVRKFLNKQNLTERERTVVDYMGLVCEENRHIKYSDTEVFTDDFYKVLEEISHGTDPFYRCEYMGTPYDCHKIFKPVVTDEGLCYTFNMLDRSEIFQNNIYHYGDYFKVDRLTRNNWTMAKGYTESAGLYPYPRRALHSGAKNALSVSLIMAKRNLDHSCKQSLQGFRVSLHIPSRVPRPSQEYFRVPLNEVVLAAIRPEMITTDSSVQLYNPYKRECFFPTEKKLKYFKLYTGRNCALECLTNYTLYHCGCVNYFMPRENTTNICGIESLNCMRNAELRYELGELRSKMSKTSTNSNSTRRQRYRKTIKLNCDCMPMCSDLTYNVETSQSYWEWAETLKAETKNGTILYGVDNHYVSKLILFFKSSQFITSERHELYGPTDFLANFGGLLGLFTGFSILSLMEAIYFLTVRLCCNSRLYGYWAGPEK